jgi:hypothetical protein
MEWNKRLSGIIVAVALFIYSTPVSAYQAMTHAAITNHVASRTILSNEELMAGMGFDVIHPSPVDALLWTNEKGESECYTKAKDSNIDNLYCGAAIADHNWRNLNHYFDPRRNLALWPEAWLWQTAIDLGIIDWPPASNPDWALEDEGTISGQTYSLQDAYRYFLMSKTRTTPEERKRREQQLFLTLGHVLHNLQDMAQPANVRNDFHSEYLTLLESPLLPLPIPIPTQPDPDYYERNTESLWKELPLTGYPDLNLKDFRTARDFWLTDYSHTDGQWQGKGLAEFSNWNFVSKDSNFIGAGFSFIIAAEYPVFADPKYDHPVPEDVTLSEFGVHNTQGDGYPFTGWKGYVGNTVKDINQGTESYNEKAATFPIVLFAPGRLKPSFRPIVAPLKLDTDTFEAARQYLIPRAAAYSAGLVNYFFRGQMALKNINCEPFGSKYTNISFSVANVSSDHTPGNAPFLFKDGTFSLYYERKDGSRKNGQPYPSSEVVRLSGNAVLDDQESKELSYTLETLDWDSSKPLILVFNGIIGEERGIAVKEFFPDPLLAFTVEGVTGDSPVANTVNVYASYDMGATWALKGGFALALDDSTVTEDNRVLIHNAINLGQGDILAHAGYIDYMDEEGNIFQGSSEDTMLRSTDYGQTWNVVDFEWRPLLDGAANVSDVFAVYRSIVYTGLGGLAGIRIQHPEQSGEPRSFQLFKSQDLGAEGSWYDRPGLGTGGLPEVDYLGQNRFGFASRLDGFNTGPGNEGGDFFFDSIMMRTDDGGETFYPLTDFSTECGDPDDPDNKVVSCIQHFEYLGKGPLGFDRLLGWTNLSAESLDDYSNRVPFHLSTDGGASWSIAMDAPFDQTCQALNVWQGQVEALIYIGKSSQDEDTLMALTECQEVYEDGSQSGVSHGPVVGRSLFFTRNGGKNWLKTKIPPAYNRDTVLLYTGDNGAIPELYADEEN